MQRYLLLVNNNTFGQDINATIATCSSVPYKCIMEGHGTMCPHLRTLGIKTQSNWETLYQFGTYDTFSNK